MAYLCKKKKKKSKFQRVHILYYLLFNLDFFKDSLWLIYFFKNVHISGSEAMSRCSGDAVWIAAAEMEN